MMTAMGVASARAIFSHSNQHQDSFFSTQKQKTRGTEQSPFKRVNHSMGKERSPDDGVPCFVLPIEPGNCYLLHSGFVHKIPHKLWVVKHRKMYFVLTQKDCSQSGLFVSSGR